jgi:hypothetical protein
MSKVFVLDANKHALNPIHSGYARLLLSTRKAAVLKYYPFTIILKETVETPQLEPLRIKLDPGSKATGLALVNDATGEVIFAAEITHRGAISRKPWMVGEVCAEGGGNAIRDTGNRAIRIADDQRAGSHHR